MITFRNKFFSQRIVGFGNLLFFIAGTIGIAVKNGYTYKFPEWSDSEFFINSLPRLDESIYRESEYPEIELPWGYSGFNIPDNASIFGFMQTDKYFAHCEELIRYYFELKPLLIEPYKDCIVMHYRNYRHPWFVALDREYYMNALKHLPDRRVVVITDNIEAARTAIGENFEYVTNDRMTDFYLMTKADYIVMGNSTFSWWGAWLSRAITIAPLGWFTKEMPQSTEDIYCKNWIKI